MSDLRILVWVQAYGYLEIQGPKNLGFQNSMATMAMPAATRTNDRDCEKIKQKRGAVATTSTWEHLELKRIP